MSHHHKLSSLRQLLKHSWHFYKANWKKLVLVFLPIEATIFVLAMVLRFGLTPARFSFVAVLAFIFFVIIIFAKVWKAILALAYCQIVSKIEGHSYAGVESTYREAAQSILSMIWVAILNVLCLLAVMALAIFASIALIILPFIILALLSRVFPFISTFINANGSTLSTTMLVICLIGFVSACLLFVSSTWFSFTTLLLEGRKGLDALAVSVSLTRGRRWQILWRLIVIIAVALIPVLITLGPVYLAILEEAKPKLFIGLLLYSKYHVIPAWPEIPSNLFVWRELMTAIASLVALPLFMTLNFLLWKDVKTKSPVFKEGEYTKTRNRLKTGVWTGLVILVLCIITVLFAR